MATVIDIASRRVVGFAMADHLRTELVTDALSNAVAARGPSPGMIFHSDYAEDGVKPRRVCQANGVTSSSVVTCVPR